VGASSNRPTTVISPVHNGFRNIHGKSHTYPVFQRQAVRIIDREESGGDGLRRPIRLCEITIT
jgi:hypothetical protein